MRNSAIKSCGGNLSEIDVKSTMIASGVRSMQIGCETDSIRSVLEIVAETDLITTMPKATTASYLEDRLVFLPFDHPQFHRPLGAIRRAKAMSSRIEDRFLKLLKQRLEHEQHL